MTHDHAEPAQSPDAISVHFTGPFSWPGTADAPSVFRSELRKSPGIYLWTVPLPEGHLVYYVGETGRSFDVRLFEHYKEHAACMYHVYSPAEFARGEKVMLWPGRYDAEHPKTVDECIAQYLNLAPVVKDIAYMYRFFLAALSCDVRVRRRVEAAIAGALNAAPDLPGTFQDKGIRYVPRAADESPIPCVVTSDLPLVGLPERITA